MRETFGAPIRSDVEREARIIAANKMGLVRDPFDERLPDELWRQCVTEAIGEIAKHEPESRTVECDNCGGDGGWNTPVDIDRRDGSLIERWVQCSVCCGEREIVVAAWPAERDDDLEGSE